MFGSVRPLTGADLHCLLTDGTGNSDNIIFHSLSGLTGPAAEAIRTKYSGNRLRWACKPLLISHLLQQGYDGVIYVDNDICFYSSPDFLFEELANKAMLLTPHYYPANPGHEPYWLEANFRVGLYNAGFIGASRAALPALDWWAGCCLYNLKKSYRRGLFDDQKYLDLLPVLFDAGIVKHKGCNVAGWNRIMSPRSVDGEGRIWLDAKWPLVFLHYNYYTIRQILNGSEPELKSSWMDYVTKLRAIKPDYDPSAEARFTMRDVWLYLRYFRYRLERLTER